MTDGVSNDPVVAAIPTPLSVEPRVAAPAEAAEISRQAEEAKVAAAAPKEIKAEPKEPTEKATPRSTKEAIRAAAAKINAEPATPLKAEPKAAEPAVVAKDAKDAPKAAEPAVSRGEDGKFVSTKPAAEPVKDAPADAAKAADAPKNPESAKVAEPAKPSHTANPPPARFSAAAKEKWAEAPEEVRAETERAVSELTKGFEKHRAAAERDAGLAEFHEMAGKSQKQLRDVVASYVGMENLLRTDTVKGLELICKNAGLSLRDVAAKVLGQAPDEVASAADARVVELEAKIARLEQGLGGIQAERQTAVTNTTTEQVTKFAADNPRFEELSDDIAFFLKSGRTKDLAEAYKLAERLNPAPAAVAPATTPAAASEAPPARTTPTLVPPPASTAGEKSIAGTPTAGSDPVRKQPSNSVKEAIRKAAAAAR